jgi:hypothetical protein
MKIFTCPKGRDEARPSNPQISPDFGAKKNIKKSLKKDWT